MNSNHRKTGGRKKGTPNKPKPYMAMLEATLEEYVGNPDPKTGATALQTDLAQLEPLARLNVVEKFLNYCKPKMQSIQADVNAEADTSIEQTIIKMM